MERGFQSRFLPFINNLTLCIIFISGLQSRAPYWTLRNLVKQILEDTGSEDFRCYHRVFSWND